MFIDTHCHFDLLPIKNAINESLEQLKKAKIHAIINPSTDRESFHPILRLAQHHTPIYAALGLHPCYFHRQQDLRYLMAILSEKPAHVVAIGEIGLDRFILEQSNQARLNWEEQLTLFRAQIKLAKQFELPVIIHSRQTHDTILHELKLANLPCKGVIHGFSGSYEQAMQFVKLGFYIGVGGLISYERAKKTRKTITKLPIECLLLETDAPSMPLFGQQGIPNRPENIVSIFDKLTMLRQESAVEIQHKILSNTLTLFSRINKLNI